MAINDTGSTLREHHHFRQTLLGLSFIFWISSLALPTLISPYPEHTLNGLYILLAGWLGIVGIEDGVNLIGVLAWWANPLYLWAIYRSAFGSIVPTTSAYLAVAIAPLTFLLSSYALNAVPSFTPIIGYGPGTLLWFLAILGLAYIVSKDTGNVVLAKWFKVISTILIVTFLTQMIWRTAVSNDSEREKLPYYSAKRGLVCSATAPPIYINERQPAIALKTDDSKHWIESLLNWGVNAVQFDGFEYKQAPKGSLEAQRPPYMVSKPVSTPARYVLHAEGGYPFINKWSDGGDFVQLTLIDSQSNANLGRITYRREMNKRLGFCPSLTYFPDSRKEEAIKWLYPFLKVDHQK